MPSRPRMVFLTFRLHSTSTMTLVCHPTELSDLRLMFNTVFPIGLASPGGHIYISTGCIKEAVNQSSLAHVIAHKLAHIVVRHNTECRGNREYLTLCFSKTGIPALLRKILQHSINTYITWLHWRHEYEADHLALMWISCAGYRPSQVIKGLKHSQKIDDAMSLKSIEKNGLKGASILLPELSLSHPYV